MALSILQQAMLQNQQAMADSQATIARMQAAHGGTASPISSFNIKTTTGTPDLAGLLKQVQAVGPTQVQTTQQNKSPETEALFKQFADTINTLNQNTSQAYNTKANSFTDLMNTLGQLFGRQSSEAANVAKSGALASGLTPLEAGGAATTAMENALAQYFPQLAQLKTGQADVGIGLQSQLAGLQQSLGLPLLNQASAYNQAVAGQTTTTENPLAKLSLLGQLLGQQQTQQLSAQNNAIEWAKLAEQQRQYNMGYGLNQQQLEQTGAYQQGQLGLGKQEAEINAQRALTDLLGTQQQGQYQQGQLGLGAAQNQTQQTAQILQYLSQMAGTDVQRMQASNQNAYQQGMLAIEQNKARLEDPAYVMANFEKWFGIPAGGKTPEKSIWSLEKPMLMLESSRNK